MNIHNKIRLSSDESNRMMEDITLAITVIAIVHILMHIIDDKLDLIDESVIKLCLYVTLGIITYHMFTKRLVSLPSKHKYRNKN